MPIADTKKVQSLIQYEILAQVERESGIVKMDTGKSKYQAHNPDLTGANLTAQEVSDWNNYHNALKQAQIDHAAIIATIKNKDIPSHGIKSLD